jgi:predicted small metal-binding protein
MKRNLIAALFTLVGGLTVTSFAFAADAAKSDDPKPPMFSAKCKSPCSFTVKSHDRQEVVAILQEHTKAHHNGLVLADSDADSLVKTSEPKVKK